MKTLDRENLQLFITTLIALFFVAFFQNNAYAAIKKINCQTAFGEKSFTIEDNAIAIHQEQDNGRSISSVMDAVTQKTHYGFKKMLYINGNKHIINIANIEKFNDSEDFLAVTNPKGHKMTYPLSCESAI